MKCSASKRNSTMNHDRLFHKGTGTVQSKKLYFVLSIVIVLGVTICFFWRVWHTSDRLVTIHGEIITSQAVDMYSQIDTIGRTDLKVIGFLDNNIISCYWIQNARPKRKSLKSFWSQPITKAATQGSSEERIPLPFPLWIRFCLIAKHCIRSLSVMEP